VRTRTSTIKVNDARALRPKPKQADGDLSTEAHRRWASEVKRRAGYRCQAVDAFGARCLVSAPSRLFADHIVERRDGGAHLDLENGQCLCGKHHTLKTVEARVERLKR